MFNNTSLTTSFKLPSIESAMSSMTTAEFKIVRDQACQREFKIIYGTNRIQMNYLPHESLTALHNKVNIPKFKVRPVAERNV